jgi:hypothetical protein
VLQNLIDVIEKEIRTVPEAHNDNIELTAVYWKGVIVSPQALYRECLRENLKKNSRDS